MNPSYQHLLLVYKRVQEIMSSGWQNHGDGNCGIWDKLESLKSGMNMDEVKVTMRDKEKRSKVVAVLRDYAKRIDNVVELLDAGLKL